MKVVVVAADAVWALALPCQPFIGLVVVNLLSRGCHLVNVRLSVLSNILPAAPSPIVWWSLPKGRCMMYEKRNRY